MARAATAKPKKEISMDEALWKSADKLRGSVEPAEYKHVVLSLFFLKFASDNFVKCSILRKMCSIFQKKAIIENAKQDDIALKIDTALYTIEKSNPALKGALPDNYYSRLHIDTSKLASLLDEINRINTDDAGNDIIGRVYEYFLSKFALVKAMASSTRRNVSSISLRKCWNPMTVSFTTPAAVRAVCSCSPSSLWRHIAATKRMFPYMGRNTRTPHSSLPR